MRFALAATTLAVVASAAPPSDVSLHKKQFAPGFTVPGTATNSQPAAQCGNGYQLYCCNQVKDPKGTENQPPSVNDMSQKPGLLDGLLGAIIGPDGLVSHLLGQCARVDVAVPGGADVLSSQCRAKAACCHDSPSIAYGGLINIALPCIAFDGLL